jgi:hypothetical protein
VELLGEIEQDDSTIKEFTYAGGFTINGDDLELELEGEYDEETTGVKVLRLTK